MSEIQASQSWLKSIAAGKAATDDKRSARLRFYIILFASDILALSAGFNIGREIGATRGLPLENFGLLTAIIPIYFMLGTSTYTAETLERWRKGAWRAFGNLLTAFLLTIFIAFLLKQV